MGIGSKQDDPCMPPTLPAHDDRYHIEKAVPRQRLAVLLLIHFRRADDLRRQQPPTPSQALLRDMVEN